MHVTRLAAWTKFVSSDPIEVVHLGLKRVVNLATWADLEQLYVYILMFRKEKRSREGMQIIKHNVS
jgi:hypothetical protein